jgi:hypothetical protein
MLLTCAMVETLQMYMKRMLMVLKSYISLNSRFTVLLFEYQETLKGESPLSIGFNVGSILMMVFRIARPSTILLYGNVSVQHTASIFRTEDGATI